MKAVLALILVLALGHSIVATAKERPAKRTEVVWNDKIFKKWVVHYLNGYRVCYLHKPTGQTSCQYHSLPNYCTGTVTKDCFFDPVGPMKSRSSLNSECTDKDFENRDCVGRGGWEFPRSVYNN